MKEHDLKISRDSIKKWIAAWHYLNQRNLTAFLETAVELKCEVMASLVFQREDINPDSLASYYEGIRLNSNLESQTLDTQAMQDYLYLSKYVHEIVFNTLGNPQASQKAAINSARYYMVSHAIINFLPKSAAEDTEIDFSQQRATLDSYVSRSMPPILECIPNDNLLTNVNIMLMKIKARLQAKPSSELVEKKISEIDAILTTIRTDKSLNMHKLISQVKQAKSGHLARHDWWILQLLAYLFPQLQTKSSREMEGIQMRIENHQEMKAIKHLGLFETNDRVTNDPLHGPSLAKSLNV